MALLDRTTQQPRVAAANKSFVHLGGLLLRAMTNVEIGPRVIPCCLTFLLNPTTLDLRQMAGWLLAVWTYARAAEGKSGLHGNTVPGNARRG